MMLTPSGVSTCPRRGRGKAASPLVSRMPRLNKHTNGSHPEQQDLLHAIVRHSSIAQVASTKNKRSPHATALQEPSHTSNEDSLRNGEDYRLTAPVPALIYPSILTTDLSGQKERPSALICQRASKSTSLSGRPRKEKPDPFKHRLLAQFGFQPFKKCFYGNCSTIFVPGDFKPSSPRRMFCSTQCFEEHWRQKLFRYLEKTLAQGSDDSTANSATTPATNSYVSL